MASVVDEMQEELCEASQEGYESDVESLCASLRDLGEQPHVDALCLAGGNGHVGIAASLLSAGSNIDLVSPKIGFNALHFSAMANKGDMVRFLVDRGAGLEVPACRDLGEVTAVVMAAAMGNQEVALFLVGKGALLPEKAHAMACALMMNLGGGKATLPLGLMLGDPACEYMIFGLLLESMEATSPYHKPALTEQQQKDRLRELQAARADWLQEERRLRELAEKRADNMDRRMPFIRVLAENRFRPLAHRLLEVPAAPIASAPAGPVSVLLDKEERQRVALGKLFVDEHVVRYLTAFL